MRAIDNVLIAGAGLAGMTLATALKRNGRRPEVIEIHPRFEVLVRQRHSGFDLRGSAGILIDRGNRLAIMLSPDGDQAW